MGLDDVLKPKDSKSIVIDLVDNGTIDEKYTILIAIFDGDFNRIREEFNERGIDAEDLIDAYISVWGEYKKIGSKPGKIEWILSDILKDNIHLVTEEILKKSFENES